MCAQGVSGQQVDENEDAVWAGEGLQEWDWLSECTPLVPFTTPLRLQETVDLINDIQQCKVRGCSEMITIETVRLTKRDLTP
jgi:hypothetical protein